MKQEFTMEYYPRLEQLFLSKNFENIRLGRVMLDGFKKPKTHKKVLIGYIELLFLSGDGEMIARGEYLFRHLSSKEKYYSNLLELIKKLGEKSYVYKEGWYMTPEYSSEHIINRVNHTIHKYGLAPKEKDKEEAVPRIFRTIDLTNQ